MIGVLAKHSEYAAAREFFELFKTPWEFCQNNKRYDVVLCTTHEAPNTYGTYLTIVFAGRELGSDASLAGTVNQVGKGAVLSYAGARLPIYGTSAIFSDVEGGLLSNADREQYVVGYQRTNGTRLTRVGYDLFHEVEFLLTQGQPAVYASTPTLDLHIQILRTLIIQSGAMLTEIPPFPQGFRLIACLTHDIDHPFIKRHHCDHTILGFIYRASVGSLFDYVRGRKRGAQLVSNWKAILKLPFVYLGLTDDIWAKLTSYVSLENGKPSSFFVIPFRGIPGRKGDQSAPRFRAAKYCASDLATDIRFLQSAGCEVALHGLDAWADLESARTELEETCELTGKAASGVRMHWLYYDERSPHILETAGADYDSTAGYNDTIGYKAGTTQSYKPLSVSRLLELPLHIMDTALFYPKYLNLSPRAAKDKIRPLIEHAGKAGGVLTINWHDRSIAPERLWGDFYEDLITDLDQCGAWFATAADVVNWFRKRRSVVLDDDASAPIKVALCNKDDMLPSLDIQIHNQTHHVAPEATGQFDYAV